MNRVARLLAVAGLGLGAAVAIGAGPAQAAPAAPQTTTQNSAGSWGYDDDEVVGYFRTRGACERVGFGHRGGGYVLTVEDWNDNWDNHNWYGGWYNSYRGGDFGWYRGGHSIFNRFNR
jgi:hypothetical protein